MLNNTNKKQIVVGLLFIFTEHLKLIIMEKPLRYSVFEKTENGTKFLYSTNIYVNYFNEGLFFTMIDTRYDAKLRLYNWWGTKNKINEQEYKPFKGTELGETSPILNF